MRSPSHVLMPLFDSVKSSRVGRVAHLICVVELRMTYDSKGKKEWDDLCESSWISLWKTWKWLYITAIMTCESEKKMFLIGATAHLGWRLRTCLLEHEAPSMPLQWLIPIGNQCIFGWWFHFFKCSSRNLGENSNLTSIFSNGLEPRSAKPLSNLFPWAIKEACMEHPMSMAHVNYRGYAWLCFKETTNQSFFNYSINPFVCLAPYLSIYPSSYLYVVQIYKYDTCYTHYTRVYWDTHTQTA